MPGRVTTSQISHLTTLCGAERLPSITHFASVCERQAPEFRSESAGSSSQSEVTVPNAHGGHVDSRPVCSDAERKPGGKIGTAFRVRNAFFAGEACVVRAEPAEVLSLDHCGALPLRRERPREDFPRLPTPEYDKIIIL